MLVPLIFDRDPTLLDRTTAADHLRRNMERNLQDTGLKCTTFHEGWEALYGAQQGSQYTVGIR